jgi:hypothetical protein
MAAGDIVLAGFPKAQEKFRSKISEKVDAAKKRVNELADALKAGVTNLLDLIGSVLEGALSLLEKVYLAAVDAVAAVVNGVLKAAQAYISALADFAVIASHIASGPGQWLRNLGASLLDGVRNHVWPALVKAVKDWFRAKVEEVVGVGKMFLDILRKGGITFAKIVTMAWTAIKESLPGIVIQMIIEKLIAMLIPGGGALALIIDGIRAAWASASRILAAIQKFFVFLKAVKAGNAGPKFADLVAAAAVAVIEFIANFVLVRLKGAGSKVGGTLRKLAEKFGKVVKKVAGVLRRGAGTAVRVVKQTVVAGAKAVKRVVVAGAKAVKRGVLAVGRRVAKVARKVLPRGGLKAASKAAGVFRKGAAKVKQFYAQVKAKIKQKLARKGKKPKKPKLTLEQRIDRTRARLTQLLDRGVNRVSLWLWVKFLAFKYKWRRLATRKGTGREFTIRGDINPVDLLVLPGQAVPLPSNPFVVTVNAGESAKDFGKSTETAGGYESAGGKLFAGLLGRSFKGREVVLDDRRYAGVGDFRRTVRSTKTTADRVVVSPQLKTIEGDRLAGKPKLDYRAVVGGQEIDPTTGAVKLDKNGNPIRDRSKDVVYIFEPTLMTDFLQGKSQMYQGKQTQALNHLLKLVSRKEFADVKAFVYTIATPASATADVQKHLSEVQQAIQKAAPGTEVYIVHRTVGK